MTRRGILAGAAASIISLATSSCALGWASYRFKVTVEVDTPEGLRTGSSVMQISAAPGFRIGDSSGLSARLSGEAVAIDLPGGTIFMLLNDLNGHGGLLGNVTSQFVPDSKRGNYADVVKKLGEKGAIGRSALLNRDRYPLFVYFEDLTNPLTIKPIVNAEGSTVFGERISIRAVRLEITNANISYNIKSRLKWAADKDVALDSSEPFPRNPKITQLIMFSYFLKGRK